MRLRPGSRLRSTRCETEVVVVRAPESDVDVRCGGDPMVPLGTPLSPAVAGDVGDPDVTGCLVGKRYGDEDLGLELLCTKGGKGSLAVGDRPLQLRKPKILPSSD